MNKLYHVHLYREMRLSFPDIQAGSPQEAADLASHLPTEEATSIEDCNGDDFGAVVDVQGDEDYSQSVTIDFDCERLRKASPSLLSALQDAVAEIELLRAGLLFADGRQHPSSRGWECICDKAHAAIAEATTAVQPIAQSEGR
jgi:hypothetical protein